MIRSHTTYSFTCDSCYRQIGNGFDNLEDAVHAMLTRGQWVYSPICRTEILMCRDCYAKDQLRKEMAEAKRRREAGVAEATK